MEVENIDNMPEEDAQAEEALEPQATGEATETIPVIEPTVEPDMSYQQVTVQDAHTEEPPIATVFPRPANVSVLLYMVQRQYSTVEKRCGVSCLTDLIVCRRSFFFYSP